MNNAENTLTLHAMKPKPKAGRARRGLFQGLNDLPVKAKMLLAGTLVLLLFAVFVVSAYLNYRGAVQRQELNRQLQASLFQVENVFRELNRTPVELENEVLLGVSRALAQAADLHARSGNPERTANVRAVLIEWNRLAEALPPVLASPTQLAQNRTALNERLDEVAAAIQQLLRSNDADMLAADEHSARTLAGIFIGIAVLVAALFFWLYFGIGGRLGRMNKTVREMEQTGDLSLRLKVDTQDELGRLADTCNKLAAKTADILERERLEKQDQDEMVELILDVVEHAAKGDLTRVMLEFHGDKLIDHLANRTRTMIDGLSTLIAEVRKSGFEVAQSTSEISSSGVQQEATVTELAATSNEITASATEIAATSRELVRRIDGVYDVMESTTRAAMAGHQGIHSMEASMNAMVKAIDGISSKLETLSDKASNINVVISTISKVSEQTNLLSLNAAIEAEKAGEYGKGFGVVAREIRRLADQTAVSTLDIERMVKEIQSSISSSVMAMEKVSKEIHQDVGNVNGVSHELSEIIEQVETLLPSFETVKESIHAQSDGAEQISESIQQLNQSTQEAANSLRKSNDAVQRLKNAVQVLNRGVARFKIS